MTTSYEEYLFYEHETIGLLAILNTNPSSMPIWTKLFKKGRRNVLFEYLLVRKVDNYQKYLCDIVYEIFLKKPDILKSKSLVEVQEVLCCDSLQSFIKKYAEKKVHDLSYQSFESLQKYFSDTFKITIIDNKKCIANAIAIRNICVHNRCKIDETYIKKTKENPKENGNLKIIDGELMNTIQIALYESAKKIDAQAKTKFKLDTVQL